MNNLKTNIAATLIVIIVFFFIGRLLFLSGSQVELEQTRIRLEQSNENYKILEIELEKFKKQLNAAPPPTMGNRLLTRGEEPVILRFFLDKAERSFRLNGYELLESYRVKPEENSFSMQAPSAPPEELQQLDENGMPVGLSEEPDEEWPGVEVIPVRFSFSTTFRTLGMFLSEAGKGLPMHTVRSMDLVLKNTGVLRGTMVMAFPVAESRR